MTLNGSIRKLIKFNIYSGYDKPKIYILLNKTFLKVKVYRWVEILPTILEIRPYLLFF